MSSPSDELRACLRLHLSDLSPPGREGAVRAAGGLRSLLRPGSADLARAGVDQAAASAIGGVSSARLEHELARVRACGAHLVHRGDPAFPSALLELPDPPWVLWVRGRLPPPERLALTVVGTRRPSPYGRSVTRHLVGRLAELGFVIVSGGARGVDGLAHAAALDAGALTVAVLGCGVDVAYPPEHRALFRRIAGSGAVVSELPLGAPPRRGHFPVRNRLLAGWSRLVLVTEAAERSGSLITVRAALGAGRDVLAVPGPIQVPQSEGTNLLIASGARLTRGAADVLAELRPDELDRLPGLARPAAPASPPAPARGGLEELRAALCRDRPASLESLVQATGWPPARLLARLVTLEALGIARGLADGSWVLD